MGICSRVTVWFGGLLALAVLPAAGHGAAAERPNVLVILADDLGFSDLGCYGGEIDTPQLDALAAGGLRFTQGYNTARCWPSRGALLTGYYAQSIRRDVLEGGKGGQGTRPAWARLLPELLAGAGYRSYHSGKWHVDGKPLAAGFARSLQIEGGQNDFFDPTGITIDGKPVPATKDFYVTTAVGEHAVECLKEHAASHAGQPFFQYVAFTAPHFPLQAPQELIAKYRERYRAGWNEVQAARAKRIRDEGIVTTSAAAMEPGVGPPYPFPEATKKLGPGEVTHPVAWASLTAEQREFQATKMAIHAAMIDAMDQAVGRIVAQLKAMGAFENTLILFASDNGGSAEIMVRGKGHDQSLPAGAAGTYLCLGPGWSSCANTPFRRHKTWVHEGGIATPWIVHWPKGIGGRGELRTQPVHLVDVVPTVLELAAVAPSREHAGETVPPLQGRSFAGALATAAAPPAHELLWWLHEGNRAVRVGDWKLVASRGGPWELYDLSRDRCETTDLAADEPGKVAALAAAWDRMTAECRALAAVDGKGAKADGKDGGRQPQKSGAAKPQPNVVVIFCDDLGYGDPGCYGGRAAATPQIDRLAREGVRFTDFHVAQPVCSASRTALLTGCYPNRLGIHGALGPKNTHGLAAAETTLAELLRDRGYRTAAVGKWHLGHQRPFLPIHHGFDEYFGLPYSNDMWPHHPEAKAGSFPPLPLVDGDRVVDAEVTPGEQATLTARYVERAVAFIDRAGTATDGRPFFLYLAHSMPHVPLFAGSAFRGHAAGGLYGDVLAEIDASVGAVLAALDRTGHADDTLVVFTSDNGPWLSYGNHAGSAGPLREGKGTVFEGGVRVPCVARLPGRIPAGRVCDTPLMTIDLLPTLAGLTGEPLVRDAAGNCLVNGRRIDGHDRWPAFAATAPENEDEPVYFFWHGDNQLQAVRAGRWKLFLPHQSRTMQGAAGGVDGRPGAYRPLPVGRELYDLATDVGERRDVSAGHPDVVARLEALAESARADLGDRLTKRKPTGSRPADVVSADGVTAEPAATPASQTTAAPSQTFSRATAAAVPPNRPVRRPNIIYVMTDDQGYGDIAAHGNPVIRTPHLDRMHAESVRLPEFHASPTCSPTRSALMTGRHEFRSGVTHTILERERLALAATTLPQLLKTAGYTSGIFGKWHLGDEDEYQPAKRGFDRVFIHGAGGIGQTFPGSCGDVPGNSYFDPVIRSDGTFVKTKGYCTDVFFDAALEWIDERRTRSEPFFCYITPNAPHGPLDCPVGSDEPYLARLESAGIKDAKQRREIAKFYGMIENIDANIGRLFKQLDAWGLAEDTLVVFTTDNGTATGARVFNDGMRGSKGTPYRGGTRVPSFWRWKGRLPGGVDAPAHHVAHLDVLPTLCEFAGAAIPPAVAAKVEGRSLVPLLEGRDVAWSDRPLVTHVGRWERGKAAEAAYRNCRIREGRWSLVNTRNRRDAWELYDIVADAGEARDVAAEHPEIVQRLATTYDQWWQSVQPDLVNEDLDGPPQNPFKVAYRKQFGTTDARPRRPNIVFFLCDDLGTGDVGALGSKDIRTPSIDRLFARGTRLSRHWAGCAVCAPSRCVLMTGRHPGHAVVRSNREVKPEGQAPMPAGTVTLASLLHDAGYATGGFGKWGLGAPGSPSEPLACGFDRFFGYNCQRQAHSFYPDHLWDNRERVDLDGKTYSADLIAERQLEFVRANAGRPFFLYVPTTVPHLALQVPDDEPSLAAYRRHFQGEQPYTGGRGYTPTEHPLATYAAMITRMDREVGRLVALLEELDLADDTIFVFSSDNGGTFPGIGGLDTARLKSNGDLREWKGSPYEGGLRVPTVAVWPGRIAAARTVDAPTGFEDWLPTLLDLAGLRDMIPKGLDGLSLAGMLLGEEPPQATRMLYRELTEGRWQAAVEGSWKVVRRAVGRQRPTDAKPAELYDLAADPAESRDVAAERPEVLARMESILDREHVPDPVWPLPFADARSTATRGPPAAAVSAPASSSAAPATPQGKRRPNILFILVDDQSPFDFRFYDPRSTLQAPVLERLAAQGMVLDAAYHMGSFSGAVCVPSRHMLMCGRSVWHLPIGPGQRGGRKKGQAGPVTETQPVTVRCPPDILSHTLAAVFNRAGYGTMRTCKKENCYPAADELFTVRHVATKRGDTPETGSPWHAEQVLAYLDARTASGDQSPFFINLGFSHPHDTRDGMPDLLAKYGARNHTDRSVPPPLDPRQPPLPANWLPRHPFDNTELRVRDEVAVPGVWQRRDEATIRNELGREFACSELIDTQIGRVLDKLAAAGELDNTWIVYTADHGIAIGRHGLQGKQNLYEHTWRVPMVVKGPGVKPGSRALGNVYLLDLLATFCDIAGLDAPTTNEGRSFKPVLEGHAPVVRDVLYGVYSGGAKPGMRSVREGDWKLIVYENAAAGVRETQLFNLRDNPDELLAEHHDPAVASRTKLPAKAGQTNLATDPAHAAKLAALQARLLAEMERHDDPSRFWNQPPLQGDKP